MQLHVCCVKVQNYLSVEHGTERCKRKFKFKTNTDSEPTNFKQSTVTYLEGDDCKNGALIPKADTEY